MVWEDLHLGCKWEGPALSAYWDLFCSGQPGLSAFVKTQDLTDRFWRLVTERYLDELLNHYYGLMIAV